MAQSSVARNVTSFAAAKRESFRYVTSEQLREAVLGGDDVAVVDVREGDRYVAGHISVAVELPHSEIELKIDALVPRRATHLIVTDDDGGALAESAAERLAVLGYTGVSVLKGGLAAWRKDGYELITGQYSLSKALGEFVERRYHTPRIDAEELHRRINSSEKPFVLDTRPLDEFHHISIPTGVAAPGAELLYRVFEAVPSPTTPIVVNCAGRTRAIIGAQALLNAGIPNPIVSLENGTQAWQLAGYEPSRGEVTEAPKPQGESLDRAKAAAERVAEKFDVQKIDRAQLERWTSEQDDRTLYVFDVRTAAEYAAGHISGARSAPGGQLVQTTDRYVATRSARIVLVDDPDLVRATITASWLIQLGLANVFIYPAAASELVAHGAPIPSALGDVSAARTVTPQDLKGLLDKQSAVVIDLEAAPPYFIERRYIPGSIVGRRSTLAQRLSAIAGDGPLVLTSGNGLVAELAAVEIATTTKRPVFALKGGTDAWAKADLPVVTGVDQPSFSPDEALPPLPTLDTRRTTLAAYVKWGDVITDQLRRDGLVTFRAFD